MQNFPSLITSHILDPQPGDSILDCCAAPGNKWSHLCMLMQDKGLVLGMDRSRKKAIDNLLAIKQKFGYQSLQIRYLDMTKVRIWGADIETTSASLSKWRCSCCAWEERWCTARVGEKGGMKGRHHRSDGEWRECGVHCEGVPHAAGADRGGVEVWEGGTGELWAKQRAMRVSVERKGRCGVGWCSGIIWRRSAIRSDFSLASLKRPLRIGEGSNECLFDDNSCYTMLELGIIDSELDNEKSGHCCAFVRE